MGRNLRGVIVGRPGLSAAMGRRYELERRGRHGADRRRPAALIAGEAWVGKTRLVRRRFEPRCPNPSSSSPARPPGGGRPALRAVARGDRGLRSQHGLKSPMSWRRGLGRPRPPAPVAPQLGGDDQREYFQQELPRVAVEVVRHVIGRRPPFSCSRICQRGDTESEGVRTARHRPLGCGCSSWHLPLRTAQSSPPDGGTARATGADRRCLHLTLQRLTTAVGELLAGAYRRPIPMRW